MPKQSFAGFFKRFWWWNILIDLILFGIVLAAFIKFADLAPKEKNDDIGQLQLAAGTLSAGVLHFLFLLIAFVRVIIKGNWWADLSLLIHLIGLGMLVAFL